MCKDCKEAGVLRRAWVRFVESVIGSVEVVLIAGFLGLVLYAFWPIFGEKWNMPRPPFAAAKEFIGNRCDYLAVRQNRPLYELAQKAKRVIPEGSRVFVSGDNRHQVRMKYYMLPELKKSWNPNDWDFCIDCGNSLFTRPTGSKRILLESESGKPPVAVYSAPGKTFVGQGLTDTKGHIVPGVVGNALAFDGVDDSVSIPEVQISHCFATDKDFSVAFWWRSDSVPFPDGFKEVFSNYAPGRGGIVLYQRGDAGGEDTRIYMNFYVAGNGAPVFSAVTGGAENLGQWHHYVFQREGSTLWAWCDGVLRGRYTDPVARASMGERVDLHINSYLTGTKGAVDDLRIYSRALKESEIQDIAANVSARGSGMPPVTLYSAPGKTFVGQGLIDTNGHLVPGVAGKALAFDGVDDSIEIPETQVSHLFATDKDFSLAFWWRSDSDPFPDGYRVIISNYAPDRGGIVLYQRGNAEGTDTRIYMNFYVAGNGAPVFSAVTGGAENLGQWHHYVFQREGSTLWAWCDGVLRGRYTDPVVRASMGERVDLHINSYLIGAKGAFDDLRIYSRALKESEIQDIAANASARKMEAATTPSRAELPPPVLHLTMDDDTASPTGPDDSEGQHNQVLRDPCGNPKDIPDSTLRTLLWFTVLQSLNLFGGCFLLCFLRGQSLGTIHGHLYSFALAYVLGFVWNNGIIILLATACIPLSALLIIACYVSLPVLLSFFVRRADILRLFAIPFRRVLEMPRGELALTAVFGAIALALFFWVTASALFDPVYYWDAISHWLPKARVIYGFDGFQFQMTHHNEYPILWPVSIAVHYFFTGYHSDYVAHWLVGLFLAVMLILLYHGARITRLGPAGSAAAIAMFFLFLYDDFLLVSYAEGLFTLLFGASVVVVLDRLMRVEPKGSDYVLAAIVFLGLTLAKTEGHIAVLIIGVAWSLVLPGSSYSIRHYKYWLPLLLICMIPPYAWISWQRGHGFLEIGKRLSVMSDGPPDLARIKFWLEVCLYHIVRLDPKHIMFAGGFAALIAFAYHALLKRTDFKAVFLIAIGMMAFSLVSMLGWDGQLLSENFVVGVPRQFLHGTPAIFLVCTMVLGEVIRRLRDKNV